MQLYDFQRRALAELYASIRQKIKRNLIVSPTGSGKGEMIVHIAQQAARQDRRVLIFVHRRELVLDLLKRFHRDGCRDVGTILAGDPHRNVGARIQIASTDSLRGKPMPPADLVIIDEAHRSLNASSAGILSGYPDAVVVGFTGTPVRLDRRPLAQTFDNLIVAASMAELFAAGRIVRPRVYTVDLKDLPDMAGVSLTGGDYNLKQLSALFAKKPLVGHIVRHWLERAAGRQTIVAATSLEHGAMIAAEFCLQGVAAETISGAMGLAQRRDILARFERREFPVLVQCELLIEGYDVPDVKCIVMARRTLSLTIFLQVVGRSVRPAGDLTAVVLDHAGNTHIHGPPDMDRDWREIFRHGPRKRKETAGECPVRECPGCYATIHAGYRACPHCDHVFVVKPSVPEFVEGTLVEVPAASPEGPVEIWKRLCATAHQRGHDYAWVAARYREVRREEPDRAWELGPRPTVHYTDAMRKATRARLYAVAHARGYGTAWVAAAYAREVGEPISAKETPVAAAAPIAAAAPPRIAAATAMNPAVAVDF